MSRKVIEYYHFSSLLKPQKVLQFMKRLETFDEKLSEILDEELTSGNQIIGVVFDWPEKEAVSVSLKYPFFEKTDRDGVIYTLMNDTYYGKERYTSNQSKDSIFC